MHAETSLQKYARRKKRPPAEETPSKLPYAKCDMASHGNVFGIDVLLMGDLFGQSMKPGVALLAYHLPGMKTTDDSGLDFGDDCGKEPLLTGSMSCLVLFQ